MFAAMIARLFVSVVFLVLILTGAPVVLAIVGRVRLLVPAVPREVHRLPAGLLRRSVRGHSLLQ